MHGLIQLSLHMQSCYCFSFVDGCNIFWVASYPLLAIDQRSVPSQLNLKNRKKIVTGAIYNFALMLHFTPFYKVGESDDHHLDCFVGLNSNTRSEAGC